MYNLQPYYYLRRSLICKIEFLTLEGHMFSHISEMTLTFIANLNNITYEYHLKQPKSLLEWRLFEKIAGNPKFRKAFDITLSHPLIGKYSNVDLLEN